jgi:hypothetical protein
MAEKRSSHETSRRDFVKKASYVAPLILTLKAAPALAKPGSDKGKGPKDDNPKGKGPD